MTAAPAIGPALWAEAGLAAAALAVDPAGVGGMAVRARAGPVREAFLDRLTALLPAGTPVRKLPHGVADDRLIGGLDLAATLAAGRPVARPGLLAEADGGLVIATMAERMEGGMAARLGQALDRGAIGLARDGFLADLPARVAVVALDEAVEPDEAPPAALLDRLGPLIDLSEVSHRDIGAFASDDPPALRGGGEAIARARALLGAIATPDEAVEALCATAAALGVASLRAPYRALRLARALAALNGRATIAPEDLSLAARMVLAPRATRLPAPPEETPPPPPPEPQTEKPEDQPGESEPKDLPPLDDLVLEAARAAIPERLLASLAGAAARGAKSSGRSEALGKSALHGRPLGARPGEPRGGKRLALVDTLRAAAPWQPLRRRESGREGRVEVRRDDFRIKRYERRGETTTIFAVDASGSAALHRLAEAKGAVELLLAECYVRRDRVALIAFRGAKAEIVLPPTRSLTRAKRALAGMAGGGATPLAGAILTAEALAREVIRRGGAAVVVVLSDGRANIARDGEADRPRATADAEAAAKNFAVLGVKALFVDTSPRANPAARALAGLMKATYLAMPHADARRLDGAVRAAAL